MNIIFGEKQNTANYLFRKGVYAVIFNRGMIKVLTVQTDRGDFLLPGGGIEYNESHVECLEREVLEETGYNIELKAYIGNARQYFISTKGVPMLDDGYFYLANLLDKVQEPTDESHSIHWVHLDVLKQRLVHEHQYWAVSEGIRIIH